jgi:hypothetical protein
MVIPLQHRDPSDVTLHWVSGQRFGMLAHSLVALGRLRAG